MILKTISWKISTGPAQIFWMEDKSLPFVQFSAVFPKAGADYDFKGKSGLAYLTAYLLEQGAGGLDSEAFQAELNQLGTGLSISVGRQTTAITLNGLSQHGESLWELFEKTLTQPDFLPKELELLQKQILESRLRKMDRAESMAWEELRKMLFDGSIGEPRKGTVVSLSRISLQDIKSFLQEILS